MRRFGISLRGALAVAGVVLLIRQPLAAQTSSSWASAASGNWTDAARWNPIRVPNNGTPSAGDTYNVTIGATGGSYTVSLGSNVTVNRLSLSSASATLHHTSGTLALLNASTVSNGTYRLAGGVLAGAGTLNVGGGSLVWTGGTMSGAGATVVGSNATLAINPPQGPGPVLARRLDNFGTASIGGGSLSIFGPHVFANTGVLNVNATQVIDAGGVLLNDGTINVTGNAWLSLSANLRGAGTVNSGAGGGARVDLFATQTSGGRLIGGGTYNLGGTHAPTGTWTIAAPNVNLGTSGFGGDATRLEGAGTFQVAPGGAVRWHSGTMAGDGRTRVLAGATLDLPGGPPGFEPRQRTLARLLENAGTMTVGPGTLTMSGGTLSNLAGGTLRVTADHAILAAGAATASLVHNAGVMSTTGFGTVVSVPVRNDGSLTVASGRLIMQAPLDGAGDTRVGPAELRATRVRQRTLTIDGGGVQVLQSGTDAGTSRVEQLIISGAPGNWTGVLDLRDNDLVIDYAGASPLATIADQLRSGHNGGSWNGAGIRTSLPLSGRSLGFGEAASVFTSFPATFSGQSVDNSAVLVRFTRVGDANLDGAVSLQDFNRLAASFGATSGAIWSQGDFNYDARVNLQDFNLLAANFGLSAAGATVTPEDWADLAAVVPEPAVAMLFAVAASGTLMMRRRHRRCLSA